MLKVALVPFYTRQTYQLIAQLHFAAFCTCCGACIIINGVKALVSAPKTAQTALLFMFSGRVVAPAACQTLCEFNIIKCAKNGLETDTVTAQCDHTLCKDNVNMMTQKLRTNHCYTVVTAEVLLSKDKMM